ncbi:LysR family transcriptional regulator [Photobacterium angustum]|uniref:Transcriptional regulator, LysR family protein n=2 Tax=Photobacterium angustum TaxID=661 RepID=Q1ZLC7_PHOAS|nr:LysR family transcriptional regulator [Photobacterium angustum]KJF80326.1 LysR family transcriptional regulator [Photobacterium damselae subsp. damselae]EAS62910.1 transcriptional regulator, LysR family protein [Vibrio angustum S14] [Photobacterium angustum S14]KJF93218.1 LysR family transcriptional regulator [Photobacterium angustum]KJG00745.1 LysR family transcriptional regulator [Photobacterium angustum]KJG05014.1 LysR family transcriptional regulator [Photobacterium angustum]
MNIEKLARLDLNLLVCFKVLIEELNVTRTAHRLCLSQSAVSKSLAKLRTQFNDPLFIRSSHGLSPTPRTLFLKPKLDLLINQLELLTQPEDFYPHNSEYRFQIATVESVYPLILPQFLPAIFQQAPSVTISTHAWTEQTFKMLQRGELDLGITGKDIDINDAKLTMLTMFPPDDIIQQEIYRDHQMCIIRKDHPALRKCWNLEAYLSLRHVQVRCDGNDRWLLDYRLADMGYERDIAVTVPDFNSAASLCSYTDFIFTAPNHFLKVAAKQSDMVVLPLPLEFPPMAYTLFWHRDRENDQALTWLRNIITQKTHHLR